MPKKQTPEQTKKAKALAKKQYKTPEQKAQALAKKQYKMGPTAKPTRKKSKPANTPGEGKRGFSGMVNRMVAMSESQFNKMIKNIRAKRR